jgi:hypothetical protein
MHNHLMYYYHYPYYHCGYPSYNFVRHLHFRQPDQLEIPESAKTKRVIPIGDEFFVPEFKITQCNTSRLSNFYEARRFKISMNRAKRAFRSATESVKATARKWNEEINKFLGDNSAEISRVEKEIRNRWMLLSDDYYDCPPNQIETAPHCKDNPQVQQIYAEIKALEKRLQDLRSKRSVWDSFDSARQTFQNNMKELATKQIPNVAWPESWPTLEEMEYLPVLIDQELDLPKTLKDINIDPELIQDIQLPQNIIDMVNIPEELKDQLNLDALKGQIQFEDLQYTAKQVLTDLKNQALAELEKYNMCLFIKNSPYRIEIQLEYVSDLRTLVENYVYGCIEKAKNAAILVFVSYIPSIINSYGATIGLALSNAFSTFWTTLKKCLFDVYNAFKQDIKNIINAEDFAGFLKAIEKYVSLDIALEKRTVPWENKGSLVDLVSNRSSEWIFGQLPFEIPSDTEYTQSDPQISVPIKDYALDAEALRKIIDKCASHGMWIFVILYQKNVFGKWIGIWLNVRSFTNDVLSGYTITRTSAGKVKNNTDIPLNIIRNLECYDSSTDSHDNMQDLFKKTYIINPCSPDFLGIFFGKGFIDVGRGVYIYYEIYECGVKTGIYMDGSLKSELYIPRFGSKLEHAYDHPLTPTQSYRIIIDITKGEEELQQRLRIGFNENVLNEMVQNTFWKMKLPW